MQETTFGPHVNSTAERIAHRTNRRFVFIDELPVVEAVAFGKYCQKNRRVLNKPRKIK